MADTENNKHSNSPAERAQERNEVSSHAERRAKALKGNSPSERAQDNAPALRFPGFTEPWKKFALGEIVSFEKKRIHNYDLRLTEYVSTDNMLADFGGIRVANRISETGTSTSFIKGDILVSNIRPYLNKIWRATFDGGCSPDVFVYRAKKELVTSPFLYNILANNAFITYVMNGAKGVKMPRGDKEQMMKYPCSIPTLQEQDKISSLLQFIDERISTQRRLIEDLEKLKSSIIDRCYKGGDNIKLEDFISQVSYRNKLNHPYKVMSVSNINGFIPQSELFTDREIASENTTSYKIVTRDIFAYNPARINIGSIARFKGNDTGIVSPMYVCFKVGGGLYPQYLEHFFETRRFKNDVELRLEGSVRLCLNFDALCGIEIPMLSLEEQKAISSAIETLVSKTVLEQKALSLMNKQRQCILSNIFI